MNRLNGRAINNATSITTIPIRLSASNVMQRKSTTSPAITAWLQTPPAIEPVANIIVTAHRIGTVTIQAARSVLITRLTLHLEGPHG